MYSLIQKPLILLPLILFMGVATFGYGQAPRVTASHGEEIASVRVYFGPNHRRGYYYRYNRPYYYRQYPYRPYYYNYPYNTHRPYYWHHRGGSGVYFRFR